MNAKTARKLITTREHLVFKPARLVLPALIRAKMWVYPVQRVSDTKLDLFITEELKEDYLISRDNQVYRIEDQMFDRMIYVSFERPIQNYTGFLVPQSAFET